MNWLYTQDMKPLVEKKLIFYFEYLALLGISLVFYYQPVIEFLPRNIGEDNFSLNAS